jgi:hypothetical protein
MPLVPRAAGLARARLRLMVIVPPKATGFQSPGTRAKPIAIAAASANSWGLICPTRRHRRRPIDSTALTIECTRLEAALYGVFVRSMVSAVLSMEGRAIYGARAPAGQSPVWPASEPGVAHPSRTALSSRFANALVRRSGTFGVGGFSKSLLLKAIGNQAIQKSATQCHWVPLLRREGEFHN